MNRPPEPPASDAPLWQLSEGELRDRLVDIEMQMRRLYGESLRVISECSSRGELPFGYRHLKHFLHDLLTVSPRDAQHRIEQAEALMGAHTVTGTEIPAVLAETGQAALDGQVSAKQVEQIHKTMTSLPASLTDTQRAEAEQLLVEHARTLDPVQLARAGRRILEHVDPDGVRPEDREWAPPVNELRVQRTRTGRLALAGEVDRMTGALFTDLLAPLAKTRTAEDGIPDLRSVAERYGDAFAELLHLIGIGIDLPDQGGEPPHLSVVISEESLRTGLGSALLDGTLPASASDVRHLACHARILPMVLDTHSVPLDVGRAARTAPAPIRRALKVRDQGCVFPGCDRPPNLTQAHHIQEWEQMGETKLANLCSLCLFHHQLLHNSPWQVRIAPDGKPELLPPTTIDPERKPRRNTIHTTRVAMCS